MRITDVLAGLEKDPQVADVQKKLAAEAEKKAAEKKAGEKKAVAGPADPEAEIDAQMGGTEMDSRAKLHAKALRAAGRQREAQTWNDPNEALNTRNTGAQPKPTPTAKLDNERGNRPMGASLPSASGKTAAEKPLIKRASLAEWAEIMSKEDGEKVASEHFSDLDRADLDLQADTYRFMGASNAIGEIRAALAPQK